MGFSCRVELRLVAVVVFELGNPVGELGVHPLLVEQRNPSAGGGDLHIVEALPGPSIGGGGGRFAVAHRVSQERED